MTKTEFLDKIMLSAQLAAALEVSGWPKPGNVHRTADFPDTTFEEFIAGSVALGPAVREAALRGFYSASGKLDISEIEIGRIIKQTVRLINSWHKGGNTHLGISLLFIPLAASYGYTCAANQELTLKDLRNNLSDILRLTTVKDALNTYDAIILASSAALGKLKSVKAPDLSSKDYKFEIMKSNVTLYEVMEISAEWDNIAKEWSTDMEITFKTGYKTFIDTYDEYRNVNIATVHTFLKILSEYPDTFIARKIGVRFIEDIKEAVKVGLKQASEISKRAKEILEIGGLATNKGKEEIFKLDKELRRRNLNPGTTADLTASSILIAILFGFRP